jgi:hypothetical protein
MLYAALVGHIYRKPESATTYVGDGVHGFVHLGGGSSRHRYRSAC